MVLQVFVELVHRPGERTGKDMSTGLGEMQMALDYTLIHASVSHVTSKS
jgi:hypothetical protein